jgi:beta-galactosidase
MSHSQVWLKGQLVGGWPYGYASYRLDLTPFMRSGENLLAIRPDNPPDSSRWYPGGGLFRNVWLVTTSALSVAHHGTFVTTPQVTARSATVNIAVTLDNHQSATARARVRITIHRQGLDGKRGPVVVASRPVEVLVPAAGTASTHLTQIVPNPRLWNVGAPELYQAMMRGLSNERDR